MCWCGGNDLNADLESGKAGRGNNESSKQIKGVKMENCKI